MTHRSNETRLAGASKMRARAAKSDGVVPGLDERSARIPGPKSNPMRRTSRLRSVQGFQGFQGKPRSERLSPETPERPDDLKKRICEPPLA
jgi:hypothetical protein